MAIVKIGNRTDKPFAIIDNDLLNDNRLSWRAKGILCYLIGRPHDWTIVTEHLVTQGTEGRDAVRSAFQELKELGYATLETHRNEAGKITGSVWTVHETPHNREPEKPRPEKPDYGKSNTTKTDGTKKEKATKTEVVEALPFESEAFKAAVGMWREHLKQKKVRTTPLAFKLQMAACESVGEVRAIAMINHSIMGNYQGLFEPKLSPIQKQAERPAITNDGIWQGYLDSLCREWHPGKPDVKYAENALRRARGHVGCPEIRDYLRYAYGHVLSEWEAILEGIK